MIPDEWLSEYFEKSGDDKLVNTQYFHKCEDGFASWNVIEGAIVVVQCYGDGGFWLHFFKDMADKVGYKIKFATTRNTKAFARDVRLKSNGSMSAKVVAYIMEIE